jgi:hypothetical protein
MATQDDVRRIALSLPGTSEQHGYGSGDFRVAGRGFIRIRTEVDGALIVLVSDRAEKDALLAADPERFFTEPGREALASVLVHLEAIELDELEELITEAWCHKAPARALQAWEESRVSSAGGGTAGGTTDDDGTTDGGVEVEEAGFESTGAGVRGFPNRKER